MKENRSEKFTDLPVVSSKYSFTVPKWPALTLIYTLSLVLQLYTLAAFHIVLWGHLATTDHMIFYIGGVIKIVGTIVLLCILNFSKWRNPVFIMIASIIICTATLLQNFVSRVIYQDYHFTYAQADTAANYSFFSFALCVVAVVLSVRAWKAARRVKKQ